MRWATWYGNVVWQRDDGIARTPSSTDKCARVLALVRVVAPRGEARSVRSWCCSKVLRWPTSCKHGEPLIKA